MFDDDLMFDDEFDSERESHDDDAEIEDVFLGNDADDAWEWATDAGDDLSTVF